MNIKYHDFRAKDPIETSLVGFLEGVLQASTYDQRGALEQLDAENAKLRRVTAVLLETLLAKGQLTLSEALRIADVSDWEVKNAELIRE